VFDHDILPGGEGKMEITISGRMLHHGRSMVTVELGCNDPRGDMILVLQGDVAPAPGDPPADGYRPISIGLSAH